MDDTHRTESNGPGRDVPLDEHLETLDPADAPPVAEELADRLSEELDAAGGHVPSDRERSD